MTDDSPDASASTRGDSFPGHSTHFGYSEVGEDEKAGKVAEVFDRVARRYDLMNDLMTWGMHRLWKRRAVGIAGVREGDSVLDLAGGTGDIAILLAKRVGPTGRVTLADINPSMLAEAERRLSGHPLRDRVFLREADAEALPFEDGAFDVVTIGFGLRNVTRQAVALSEMLRVLGSGGRMIVLEFSRPVRWFVRPFYHAYSFVVIPTLGRLILRDPASYRYLAESIRMHPDRDTLLRMLETARFENCGVRKLFFGIVAIHHGTKNQKRS
ncbi:MAG: bifunctional demethylmenaquinone methyltransferase/2-methoxy-6-polyprenyl-1,4-benzoquinol methylase UbiE [Demequinaceae bacterium]|nr:bifunctional demethylmenaquinone methyltransferase/2-methoxy-6-polyprenyl-1,4-benzoquinol methylase UbiE [Demequinaceae bacterium]